eukprot:4820006-Prymnesium_polylepis.1
MFGSRERRDASCGRRRRKRTHVSAAHWQGRAWGESVKCAWLDGVRDGKGSWEGGKASSDGDESWGVAI